MERMDYDPRHEYNLARIGHALNPVQFSGDPKGENQNSQQDFAGQMRQYRDNNPTHKGVQDYHRTGNAGFMAHVDGLVHQAGSIDNWAEPLIDHHGRESALYHEKANENEAKDVLYKGALSRAIRDGSSDPIHVSMGYHVRGDSNYGWAVPSHADNMAILGNGNHRVVQAHMEGIERIHAKFTSRGTGQDGYDDTTQEGEDQPSSHLDAPSGHAAAPLRQEQFQQVKPALDTQGQGMYAGMLRGAGKNTAQINEIGAAFGHAPVKGAGNMNTHELEGMRMYLDGRPK